MKAYTANKIFTGHDALANHAIVVVNNVIEAVVIINELPEDAEVIHFNAYTIAPAFIDNQIYGAEGKLFAMYPEPDALHRLYRYCVAGGAHHFLPTVATNDYPVFYKCIDAIRAYWKEGGKGVLGLHVEGPWINVAKRGAHIQHLIHSPTIEQVTALLKYGQDVIKIITLAPEVCSQEIVDLIHSYGVVVSAGHSNATFQQATTAFNGGITLATHLYNAMSPLQHREPGVVGAVMYHPTAMASIIADGHHVNFEAISIAKKVMGDRLFMITDAVTETDIGAYPHQREGDKFVSNGILSGSALTMLKGVQNCVNEVQIPVDEAIRMATVYPARALQMQQQLGCIAKGARANFIVLDDQLQIVNMVGH